MSKKELLELLTELLGTLPQMVLNQIEKFVKTGITYKDIARAVYFLYDVQGRDKKDISTYGIGLVPHVIAQANSHYESIRRRQEDQRTQTQGDMEIPSREVSPQERAKIRREIDISEL
jgi:hypothetical protein